MQTWIIAVCSECSHHTVPLIAELSAEPPHCVNCYRNNGNNHIVRGGIKISELHKAPKMKMIEVRPVDPPLKRRKKMKKAVTT